MLSKINSKNYGVEVIEGIKNYLLNVKDYYINLQNNAYQKLDAVKVTMQKTKEDKENFILLASHNDNENLNNLVKNASELNRCIEKDGRLIQEIDPVFQDPIGSKLGRAHFFAPRKNFLGHYYSTFWFNMSVIWMMTIILIITLYLDVFKLILDGLENLSGKILKKKIN